MNEHESEPIGTVIATDAPPGTQPLVWDEVQKQFGAERWYWLGTVGPNNHPDVRPVLAVWLEGHVYSTTSPKARKGRSLVDRPFASIAGRTPVLDIVIEGPINWINQRAQLERVAAAYQDKYGWPLTITSENAFDAPYGAPTAGPPPYRAYEIVPAVVYAFGTGEDLGVRSTRFQL